MWLTSNDDAETISFDEFKSWIEIKTRQQIVQFRYLSLWFLTNLQPANPFLSFYFQSDYQQAHFPTSHNIHEWNTKQISICGLTGKSKKKPLETPQSFPRSQPRHNLFNRWYRAIAACIIRYSQWLNNETFCSISLREGRGKNVDKPLIVLSQFCWCHARKIRHISYSVEWVWSPNW
jgi:hypothetical protein